MNLDWNQIDTVLLDMDGTLLDLHFDNFFWLQHLPHRFAAQHKQLEERAREHLQQRFAQKNGTLHWYCLDYWSEQLTIDIVSLKREIAHKIALRPHVGTFLQALRQSGRQCILVTNAHSDSLTLKLENVPLLARVDAIAVSHDYGSAKEQQSFWPLLHRDFPFDPDRTLLIDDTEAVLDAAHSFGIRHLLTLQQPDSQQEPREGLKYPAIDHFDEIMPPTTTPGGSPDAK